MFFYPAFYERDIEFQEELLHHAQPYNFSVLTVQSLCNIVRVINVILRVEINSYILACKQTIK